MPKQNKKAAARSTLANVRRQGAQGKAVQTAEYRHKDETPARPDVGTQPQFRKKAPPKTYRYDSSLSPASS